MVVVVCDACWTSYPEEEVVVEGENGALSTRVKGRPPHRWKWPRQSCKVDCALASRTMRRSRHTALMAVAVQCRLEEVEEEEEYG